MKNASVIFYMSPAIISTLANAVLLDPHRATRTQQLVVIENMVERIAMLEQNKCRGEGSADKLIDD